MSILCGEEPNHVTDDNDSERVDDDEDRVERIYQKSDKGKSSDSERTRTPFLSVFGEVSIIRDFFLAAFSDGCSSEYCCSTEGLFPGGGDATCSSSSMKHHSETTYASNTSVSGSHTTSSFERSRKRRTKPLAVAVGFKCANDYEGRPIVITPGGRRSPNSVVTRSLVDPFQNVRLKQERDIKTLPQLPDLAVNNHSPRESETRNSSV